MYWGCNDYVFLLHTEVTGILCSNSASVIGNCCLLLLTANESPTMNVTSTFNVTVGDKSTLTVIVTDPEDDKVSLTLRTELPPGANFNNETGIFTWTPADTNPVNIS